MLTIPESACLRLESSLSPCPSQVAAHAISIIISCLQLQPSPKMLALAHLYTLHLESTDRKIRAQPHELEIPAWATPDPLSEE